MKEDFSWLDESDASASGFHVQDDVFTSEGSEKSPYGVILDRWGKRRGEDLAKSMEFSNEGVKAEDAADLYGMVFQPTPVLNPDCQDEIKSRFLNALSEDAEYHALHTQTELNALAAEFSSLTLSKKYMTYKGKEAQREAREKKQQGDKPQTEKQKQQAQLRQDMAALKAANQAAKEAVQELEDLNDTTSALGYGTADMDGMKGQTNIQAMRNTFMRAKNDKRLKTILDLAGRYIRLAQSKQSAKTIQGQDEVVGIVRGRNLARVVPTELAALSHPIASLDFARRFVEGQLKQREYTGVEKMGRGPIMIAIDESSSMSQYDRITHAKAMALGMGWIARKQKRWMCFIGWSSFNQVRWIAVPPNKWDANLVMAWLGEFFSGNTVLPMESLPEIYLKSGATKGRTDLIVITDGEVGAPGGVRENTFNAWRKTVNMRTIGISIGCDSMGLKAISDDYYRLGNVSPDAEGVGQAMSI